MNLGLSLLGGWVLVCLLVMAMEPSLIFLPSRSAPGDESLPERLPGRARDVFLDTPSGQRIHGWVVDPPPGAAAEWGLLYFHGNAGNLSGRGGWAASLSTLPARVLAIDYGGYGKSVGPLSEAAVYEAAEAAYRHLTGELGIRPERVVLYGKSLGGGPATELASRLPCGALILQSVFTSVAAMGRGMFPFLPVSLLVRNRFDNLAKIGKVTCPKLVVHSRDDEVIPYSMGEAVFAAAREPKTWAGFEGIGHNELVMVAETRLLEHFRRLLAEAEAARTPAANGHPAPPATAGATSVTPGDGRPTPAR